MLACVDRFPGAAAVCAYAAWLATSADQVVDALHVEPSSPPTARAGGHRLLLSARDRFAIQGARVGHLRIDGGDVVEAILAAEPSSSCVVMGKGGPRSPESTLGPRTASVLRLGRRPLCLPDRVQLPARRALLLLDADMDHHRTVDFVSQHPVLSRLSLDALVLEPIGMNGRAKLALAEARLPFVRADVYPLGFGAPDPAVARWLDDAPADLVVLSREMLFGQERGLGLAVHRRAIWRWRPAALIC